MLCVRWTNTYSFIYRGRWTTTIVIVVIVVVVGVEVIVVFYVICNRSTSRSRIYTCCYFLEPILAKRMFRFCLAGVVAVCMQDLLWLSSKVKIKKQFFVLSFPQRETIISSLALSSRLPMSKQPLCTRGNKNSSQHAVPKRNPNDNIIHSFQKIIIPTTTTAESEKLRMTAVAANKNSNNNNTFPAWSQGSRLIHSSFFIGHQHNWEQI